MNWESSQVAKALEVKCPQCNRTLQTYEQFKWPLFIRTFREELLGRLRKFEREKAALVAERDKVQEQLAKDKRQQELLQRTVDDLRNFTVKKNEADIRKLRNQISEMEQTLTHVGKDKAHNEEKRRELEEARSRMSGLESQSEQLAAELRKKQQDVESLQEEMARGVALLEEKQRELTRLQEREVVNAGVASRATAEAVAAAATAEAAAAGQAPGSPAYYLAWAGQVAGSLGSRGWRLASKLFAPRSAAVLVRGRQEFELLELRGCHPDSAVWRARDLKEQEEEDAACVVKWKRATVPSEAFREAMLLSSLSHPNVMPLLGLIDGADDGLGAEQIGLVMPLFEHDLEYLLAPDTVDGARLPMGAAPDVAAGLLSALAYAHAQQVVHRGVASCAVLLSARQGGGVGGRSVVLGGWSEACSLSSPGPRPLVLRGAGWRYASPEYVLDSESVNWKAFDVWGAGCVLWELLMENSLAPLVASESNDLRAQVRALCSWSELREQVTKKQMQNITFSPNLFLFGIGWCVAGWTC